MFKCTCVQVFAGYELEAADAQGLGRHLGFLGEGFHSNGGSDFFCLTVLDALSPAVGRAGSS